MSYMLINYNSDQIHILVSILGSQQLVNELRTIWWSKIIQTYSLSCVDTSNHTYFEYHIVECNEASEAFFCIQWTSAAKLKKKRFGYFANVIGIFLM